MAPGFDCNSANRARPQSVLTRWCNDVSMHKVYGGWR